MTVVGTSYGKVEGIERKGVLQFLGIPFAAAPVGAQRWRPPRPPDPWPGVRPATSFGPVAPQGPSPVSSIFGIADFGGAEHPEISENCLNLNVYTPGVGREQRPVMVWIHGGSFIGGSNRNAWYDGSSFARNGVVVVTVNYRLGALGFLHLGDEDPGSGNCGLLDQVAALEWVRDNIVAFGGDPAKVTVFGESAGAMCIGSLLGMPAATGLFHGAILQSGAAADFNDRERAREAAERLTAELGCPDDLRAVRWERLLEAQGKVFVEMGGSGRRLPFLPVVDGTVLPRPPMEAIAAGAGSVPVLTGTNRDETALFLAIAPGGDLTEEAAARRLDQTNEGVGRAVYDAYRSVLDAGSGPNDIWVAAETDRRFRIPAIQLATEQARHTPDVWMYLFTRESPACRGVLGSCHALEIPFVWNSLVPASDGFTGGRAEAEATAREMHAAWIAFAAAGDPGWDRYEEGRRATRVFGPGNGIADDPMSTRRKLWQSAPVAGRPAPAPIRS